MHRKGLLFLMVFVAAALCLGTAPAWATNGYQLIGVGAEEIGMGGADTAAPMDAMTAVTNPAGMSRVGSRADFSLEAFMPARRADFRDSGEGFGVPGGDKVSGGTPLYGIPAIGWTAPAFGTSNVYFGGGMYVTSGLGVDYGQTVFIPSSSLGLPDDVTFSGYSSIQFWKMAPCVAWNITPSLSVGLAANIDYQSVTIDERINGVPFSAGPLAGTQQDVKFDLGRPTNQIGGGASLGLIYDVNKYLSVGAVYTSEQFFAPGEYRLGDGDIYLFNGATGKAGTYKLDLNFPQQASVGIAVKPIAPLLIAMDVKWIDWSSTHDKVRLDGPSDSFQKSDGSFTDHTDLNFGWSDQWVYAIGVQYTPITPLSLRLGYNYANSPIGKSDVFNNLVFPAVVTQHATAGMSYMLGDHWGVSLAYEKAFKNTIKGKHDVSSDFQAVTPFKADSNTKISLEEDAVSMQLTYKF